VEYSAAAAAGPCCVVDIRQEEEERRRREEERKAKEKLNAEERKRREEAERKEKEKLNSGSIDVSPKVVTPADAKPTKVPKGRGKRPRQPKNSPAAKPTVRPEIAKF